MEIYLVCSSFLFNFEGEVLTELIQVRNCRVGPATRAYSVNVLSSNYSGWLSLVGSEIRRAEEAG